MLKLGRIPSRHDARTLRFAKYVDPQQIQASPPARDWSHPLHAPAWGMFGNDRLGDCTCASIGHALQAIAANTDRPLAISGADVIKMYQAVGHYLPSHPETDQGAEMIDVLRYMRSTGLCGHRFGAFVSVDPMNQAHVEAALNLCGWVYVGADLPRAAQDQTVWDVAPPNRYTDDYRRNTWGPHAMAMLALDRTHAVMVTWGGLKITTRPWIPSFVSEMWAVFDPSWIDDSSMLSPSGFNLAALMTDLVEIDRAA